MLLKVATDDPKTWSEWTRRYKIDGDGIPKVYVVRADGEQLYGKTGAPRQLPQFLSSALKSSGRIPNPSEVKRLNQSFELARKALDDGDIDKVTSIVARSKSDGVFAEPAVKLRSMMSELTEEGASALTAATEAINDEAVTYETFREFVQVEGKYGRLPGLRIPIANAIKAIRKKAAQRNPYEQAKLVHRAEGYEKANKNKSALVSWKQIVTRYPDSSAAELARQRITELER